MVVGRDENFADTSTVEKPPSFDSMQTHTSLHERARNVGVSCQAGSNAHAARAYVRGMLITHVGM